MPVHVDRPVVDEDVLVVTLDRPERRNALDHAMLDGLRQVLSNALADECRVLVLTGTGGHFCAGADLSGVEDDGFVQHLRDVLAALRTAPFPVVAAIEGAALGAGMQLAVACDLRIATSSATFGIPAAKLGLTVDQWTVDHLCSQVGGAIARAMLLGAEVYSGAALHRSGFVQRLHEPEAGSVLDAAKVWAEQLAALAPLAIAAHNAMLLAAEGGSEPGEAVLAARSAAWKSADLQEGLEAFRSRRRPVFRGV